MSDTPRTDEFIICAVRTDNNWRGHCRQLERELNEARVEIAETKTILQQVDLPDEPLVTQAKRYVDQHDCQAGIAAGYEKQIQAANETLRKLSDELNEALATLARLRQDLADPPADVQEAVLDKLNLRSVITERNDALELARELRDALKSIIFEADLTDCGDEYIELTRETLANVRAAITKAKEVLP
jgi:chromosome segregation ATPase